MFLHLITVYNVYNQLWWSNFTKFLKSVQIKKMYQSKVYQDNNYTARYQKNCETDKQTERQTDRQKDRRTDIDKSLTDYQH